MFRQVTARRWSDPAHLIQSKDRRTNPCQPGCNEWRFMMQILGDMRAHFLRVIKMSKACGVDLSTALDQGQIAAPEYADMVTRCRGCSQVGKCDKLLAAIPALPQAPDYCENRDEFAKLRGVQAL
jgi:hypothetical protein